MAVKVDGPDPSPEGVGSWLQKTGLQAANRVSIHLAGQIMPASDRDKTDFLGTGRRTAGAALQVRVCKGCVSAQ
jgi:hypothetical protein